MRRPRRLDRDAVAGLALAALGGYVAWTALAWDILTEEGPGPGFFPLGYGVLMLGLSALLVLRALALPRPAERAPDSGGHVRALATWAAFAGAAFAMQWIGFVLGFAALSAFVVAFVFGRGWRQAALVGIGCAGGFWLVFGALMGVDLPAGPWGF
jgi:putative tricarboxylic transport membrane protein